MWLLLDDLGMSLLASDSLVAWLCSDWEDDGSVNKPCKKLLFICNSIKKAKKVILLQQNKKGESRG